MSPNLVWHPIRFTQQIERAYVEQMELRVVPLQRLACIIGIAAFAGYQLWDLLLDPQAFPRTAPIRLAIIALLSAELIITFVPSLRRPPYLLMQNIAVYTFVGVGFSLILAQLPNGFLAGVSGFLLGMIFIPVVVIGTVQAVATLTPLVLSPLVVMALAGATRLEIVNALSWIVGGAGFVIGFAYLLDVINRRAFQLEQLLETEKNRSERLLLNILPADIAERLKAGEEPLADRCAAVTVLFADLVGFTELSRKLRAGDVVDLLNDLFSRFDRLVERHGAEKIKTIGDAYMVAAGLSGSGGYHVASIADLALDMREAFGEFCRHHGLALKLRIGVHSGEVVAGVIGKQKFAYDLWGDTVNVASRMESNGVPGEIQISAETRQLLSAHYRAVPRGEIEIKGHLPRMTYLLQGMG
jgi:adenylate cyclase